MNRIQTIIGTYALKRRITVNRLNHWKRRSLLPALHGFITAVRSESNLKTEILLAFLAIGLSLVLQISTTQWALVILSIGLVLITEVFNTAIERLSDRVSPVYDPVIGLIKDIAAGGVLIAATISLLIGSLVFIPEIVSLV